MARGPVRALRRPRHPAGAGRVPGLALPLPRLALAPPLGALPAWRACRAGIADQGGPGRLCPEGEARCQCGPLSCRSPAPTSWGLASPSWGLSGACGAPRRVVDDAALPGLVGCRYIPGVSPFFPAAFTAHRDAGADAIGRRLHCNVSPPVRPHVRPVAGCLLPIMSGLLPSTTLVGPAYRVGWSQAMPSLKKTSLERCRIQCAATPLGSPRVGTSLEGCPSES